MFLSTMRSICIAIRTASKCLHLIDALARNDKMQSKLTSMCVLKERTLCKKARQEQNGLDDDRFGCTMYEAAVEPCTINCLREFPRT
jgi:hypothetical protein